MPKIEEDAKVMEAIPHRGPQRDSDSTALHENGPGETIVRSQAPCLPLQVVFRDFRFFSVFV